MSKNQQRKSVSRSAALTIPELEQSNPSIFIGRRLEPVEN